MRISCISALASCVSPSRQVAPPPVLQTNYRDALVAGIRGDVLPRELEQLEALLERLEAHPQGKILMDSMQAYRQWFGKLPEIVLRRDYESPRPPAAGSATDRTIWHLDLRELGACPAFEAIRQLADVYCDLAGTPNMECDVFQAYTFDDDQKLDPLLEKAWEKWISAGKQSVHDRSSVGQYRCIATRRRVIENLRTDLKQMRCYGGLTHADFHHLMKELRWGCQDCLPAAPTAVNLRAASLQTRQCMNFSSSHFPSDMEDIGPYQHKGRIAQGCASSLPPLPQDLEALCLDAYPRPDLSALPPGLKVLRMRQAGLVKLPRLPAGLKILEVAQNALIRLDNLPAGLETLIVSNNPLRDLPEPLPARLRHLAADAAQLARLPALPESLERLSVCRNRLTTLPALPPRLRDLSADENHLAEFPVDVPLTLERAYLVGNDLRRLPPACANLSGCDFYLEGNPIALQDLPRLPPGVPGPRFHVSMQAYAAAPQAAPRPVRMAGNLTEATSAWLLPDMPEAAQRWEAQANPAEAQEFVQFLNRLHYPKNTKESVFETAAFRASVVSLLTELSLPERAELRVDVYALCKDATANCDDRVLWTLGRLRALLLNDDIRLGRYDDRVGDVIELGRQMFSLDVLAQIAREKVRTLTYIDEVEVYLAYAVQLRQALRLTSVVADMLYFKASGVTPADVDNALQTVRHRQRTEFPMFLALDYEPWQTLLRRRDPDRHDAFQASAHEEMERCLEPELRSRLQAVGLDPHDDDARRTVGLAVSRDIRYRVLEPLVAEYLAHHDAAMPRP
ncbi:NEL-type E3 ubiquitin ligase domain-containing protein [Bordetella flabilis]|uniref:NEL-type E3 ubiquitin ligase domain-containing protein n=1 Tax=Bordetella flabilis TaxID=463014 RepID=UPI000B1D6C90|nr:NEL-type E3 ubiquitin ligase domain-containing protein [Bordetella flabilis]